MTIERVFMAGAGLMGHGIAQVHAVIGKDVTLYEPDLGRAVAGRDRIAGNLERSVAKGQLDGAARDAALARITPTNRLADVADADLVIEAVFEDIDVKRTLWSQIDELAAAQAIFASNTSSIAIADLAQAVGAARRSQFVGMHFFSPVPVMRLVELIRSSATSDATEAAIRGLVAELEAHGRERDGAKPWVMIVSADRPGFIVNRILMPFLAEAIRALGEGLGTADDIDTGAKRGLNHPMGPLELADFIGLDVCLGVMRVLHAGLGDERFAPPRMLEELVAAGHLGQKTGRGFHTYPR
ncbi:MAG TPA: 3-hydroxyacyl-CoA dehydrogenase NAD-binding domain-containing protein [Candidatus Limnocylindrales bacterium]|nr:3-hydroxyacyl-CoA dehydrogenase NAD-binding domain-containing protein [Candidatus Limnocylindrales bacterium]